MIRLKWSNNSMMLLSLLLAILLWVYVNNVQNPLKEQEFRVTVDTRGELPQGLSITGLPKTIAVRVQGKNGQLSTVRAADFQAVVDISDIEEGSNTRTIQVTAPSGLQVLQVNPNRVDIKAERVIEKQVSLKVVVKGQAQSGYTVLEPVVHPTTILVRGSARVLKELKTLELSIDISGARENVEQTLMVPLPAGLTSSPDRVKVLVPVTQALPSKVLPVIPHYIGTPGEQKQVVRAIVQPSTVVVYAPVEVLKNLDSVSTEAIRVDGISENILKEARLLLPEGVVDIIPGKVEVAIQVKPKQQTPETKPQEPPDKKPQEPPKQEEDTSSAASR